MNPSPILEMRNISKSFANVQALSGVNLTLHAGECHALLGENGAGKSTLIKILAGIHTADQGELYLNGKPLSIKSVPDAMNAGISVIHQELCLAGSRTAAENIFMGREPAAGPFGIIDDRKMLRDAQAILDRNGLSVDASIPVRKLTVAQQQMVEVAKALSQNARIIVMDEPTASLSVKEAHGLFDAIRRLKQGGVSIIYISHRLDELYEVCDNVTVMRDGRCVATLGMRSAAREEEKEAERGKLVSLMVGREIGEFFDRPDTPAGEPLLEARRLSRGNKVKDVSFVLRRGEILGFYGLVGAGRTEVMQLLFGIQPPQSGEILFGGHPVKLRSTRDAIALGIALVPENRKEQGGVMGQDVGFNMVLAVLKKIYSGFVKNWGVQRTIENEYIAKLRIKVRDTAQKMQNLSGGNQQKVILAKWLATRPSVLILDEPTRGIDVGAKKEIYGIMSALVRQGVSIIMVSSDLPEILGMSTRIVTMHEGRVTGERVNQGLTQEDVMTMATGGAAGA
jgi:ribose transport system ATP-binding protein/inositol transport system ATP-binding protein